MLNKNYKNFNQKNKRSIQTSFSNEIKFKLKMAHLIYPFKQQKYEKFTNVIKNNNIIETLAPLSEVLKKRIKNSQNNNLKNKKIKKNFSKKTNLYLKNQLIFSTSNITNSSSIPKINFITEPIINKKNYLKTNKLNNFKRKTRSAYSLDYYVEVLVVADYKMFHYHKKNLENYILTLFSTVCEIK